MKKVLLRLLLLLLLFLLLNTELKVYKLLTGNNESILFVELS